MGKLDLSPCFILRHLRSTLPAVPSWASVRRSTRDSPDGAIRGQPALEQHKPLRAPPNLLHTPLLTLPHSPITTTRPSRRAVHQYQPFPGRYRCLECHREALDLEPNIARGPSGESRFAISGAASQSLTPSVSRQQQVGRVEDPSSTNQYRSWHTAFEEWELRQFIQPAESPDDRSRWRREA
jgi:hypothetical protein